MYTIFANALSSASCTMEPHGLGLGMGWLGRFRKLRKLPRRCRGRRMVREDKLHRVP